MRILPGSAVRKNLYPTQSVVWMSVLAIASQTPTADAAPLTLPLNNINQLSAQHATPATAGNTQQSPSSEETEPQVLVTEVVVIAESGELPQKLQNQVYKVIRTTPERTTTKTQLQEDINAIFATEFFSSVRAEPTDTPLGVQVTFVVQPNPVLRNVQVRAKASTKVQSVLPPKIVNDIFQKQYGQMLNLLSLQEGIKLLNKWYQDNGYVLAQVVDAPQVASDGTVTLTVAEGEVEDMWR